MPVNDDNNNNDREDRRTYHTNQGRQRRKRKRRRRRRYAEESASRRFEDDTGRVWYEDDSGKRWYEDEHGRRYYEDESESETDTDEENSEPITGKCWGLIIQIIMYVINTILWIMAICAAMFALVIGLETETISCSDGNMLDWTISTPATVFLFYSWPILAVATFGCFAIVSANFIALIIYIILLLLLTVFDAAFGISLMGSRDGYDNFIFSLHRSIQYYGANTTRYVGILPINATKYWDHLQRRGKCCGLYSYMDWQNTTMARTAYSIPDSCCNKLYDYEGCGQLIWKHPDHELHTLESIIHDRGCLTIFPWFIQDDNEDHLHVLGIVILIFIIVLIILGIILFLMVISKFFKTPTGLNNPEFPEVPADPTLHTSKVHPEDGPDSRGDWDEDGRYTERKISFDSGPTYIPERQKSVFVYERRRSSGQSEPPTHVRRTSDPKEETIFRRRSSGPRETSPPRQVQKENYPPRQTRRASRDRSPPRQVRRLSVQKETSPSSHSIFKGGTRRNSLTDREARHSLFRN